MRLCAFVQELVDIPGLKAEATVGPETYSVAVSGGVCQILNKYFRGAENIFQDDGGIGCTLYKGLFLTDNYIRSNVILKNAALSIYSGSGKHAAAYGEALLDLYIQRQIYHVGISGPDQINLPLPVPVLQLFFPCNSINNGWDFFKIDEVFAKVAGSESTAGSAFVLFNAFF